MINPLPDPVDRASKLLRDVLENIYQAFLRHRSDPLQAVAALQKQLSGLLADGSSFLPSETTTMLLELRETLQRLAIVTQQKVQEGILFSEKAVVELRELFEAFSSLLRDARDLSLTANPVLRSHILQRLGELQEKMRHFATEHEDRLIKGICLPRSSELYLSAMDSFKSIASILERLARRFPDR